ncbi:L-galactose dehydrogenase-like protein [Leptotrombidium deliense]|uniref:L-galactose dehydrogenase-like protein n=1 Tax=Leptotrombidium deliense TaxID=299467 RepID=A0A443SDR4_9ACAR|nr:L-galactose dehydrogenase-like protein [Leptotrombidium deliense]
MADTPATFLEGFHNLDEIKSLKYKRLGETDLFVPPLTFGGAHLSHGVMFDNQTGQPITGHENAVNTIREAIKRGINYFDVAPLYGAGKCEIVLGVALQPIPRSAYYIATKVGRNHNCQFDYSASSVLKTVEESLRRLRLSYIDVVHVHDIEFADFNTLLTETLPVLDKLRNDGIVKYIAINCYPIELLKETIEKSKVKIDIIQSYCRCTLFDNSLVDHIPYFKERKIGIINAASYGMGLLTKGKLPDWHPAKLETIEACAEATKICNDRGVDISRLAIDHAFRTEGIDTTLVGLKDVELLNENLHILRNGLDEKELEAQKEVSKVFEKLTVRHWEGIELEKYRRNKTEFENYLKGLAQ